ncbi:Na+/H+ antiporter [Streptomyces hoynatensis]|uniref:Na+/H+ antiporter n=1 Tax=Streptomyces hoynatensis TaxID=1141874 RepID=A0A3A9Z1I4_9ACTN|nr:Na+/H+ antiporter [Streptomyces hoynatensis]RKN42312.1 Na+/H+ antiporter [Streptomyces hoynatensis]
MDQLTLLLILLLGALVTVPLGERLTLPPPVLTTVLGGLLAFLPFVPRLELDPELILPLVLPPVLFAAARRTSWRQFTANLRPILLLAVALVFVTTAAVAAVTWAALPGLPVAAAIALGALVAPPDPIAATAVAGQLGLPRRMVSVLAGEGLFNDVAAITMYNVAVEAVVSGSFSLGEALLDLLLSAVVAIAVGLALGWVTARLRPLFGEVTLRVGFTLVLPFVAWTVAEQLHGSAVLAVLVMALYLGEQATDPDDVAGRLTGASFWEVVDTLVTGVAFGLIGLELHSVLDTTGHRWDRLLPTATLVLVVVLGVRLLWLLPAAWLTQWVRKRAHSTDDVPLSRRETVVMWWSGMRGVATVALALALPLRVDDGGAFPQRDALIFVAFVIVLVTLVAQGLTLPRLTVRLGVRADRDVEEAFGNELALRASRAAKRRLAEIERRQDLPEEVSEALVRRAYDIGVRISPGVAEDRMRQSTVERTRRVREIDALYAELLAAARREVLEVRSEPGADPELVDRALRELDRTSLPHGI